MGEDWRAVFFKHPLATALYFILVDALPCFCSSREDGGEDPH